MKKTLLIIMVLAMVLGLTQCKKPVMPGGGQSDEFETISFTANGDGGEKGDLYQLSTILHYKWATGDKVYVYGAASSTFSGGELIGILNIESGVGTYTARFEGQVKKLTNYSWLRFVHFGKGTTHNSTTGYRKTNFGTQNGVILTEGDSGTSTISDNVIAVRTVEKTNGNSFGGSMEIQFAVVKFNLSSFGSGNVTMKSNKGINVQVNANGTIEYVDSQCTLNDVTATYNVAVMPGTGSKLEFDNGAIGSFNYDIVKDKFYYPDGHPEQGLTITAVKPYIDAKFSIGDGKYVYFSKGALYYDGTNWGITDNQWDFYTYYGGPYCAGNEYHSSGSPRIGTFAWSMSSNNYGINVDCSTYVSGDGAFIDWGSRIGSGWRTLSKAEVQYLYDRGSQYYRHYHMVAINSYVAGFVFLPDNTSNPKAVLDAINVGDLSTLEYALNTYNGIFVPSAGWRKGNSSSSVEFVGGWWVGGSAMYWLCSTEYTKGGYVPQFYYDKGGKEDPGFGASDYGYGRAVRLVRDAPSSKEE